jgi:phage terminase large subunit
MPKQMDAHSLEAKYRGLCGGWGNGKTSWGCVEFFVSLLEYPGTNSIVARKTRPELKATTWDMLLNGDKTHDQAWHGIPPEAIKYYNRSDYFVELRNGSKIWGMPLDDPKKIENFNLGLFWIDQAEEVEEDIFLKFQGRLRQHRSPREGLLTFNPAGHNWLWKRFIDPTRISKFKRLYKCVEATTFDNPNLPSDYFEQFEGLPEHWVQRFVYGSHEVFTGQIFTDWDPEVHVVQPFLIPSKWERWMSFDPGMRHEAAASWCARDYEGNVFYYREVLAPNQPIEWWYDRIIDEEEGEDYGGPQEEVAWRLIGQEAKQRSQESGVSVKQKFTEFGMDFQDADRDPPARISTITEYLRPRPGHTNPWTGDDPAPRVYVFSTCDKLQEYLPQYRWRPQRTNFSEEDAPEKPRKKDDHNIDNLGHVLVHLSELPPLEDVGRPTDPELAYMEEHFDMALERARDRSPVGSAGGRHPVLGDDF